MSRARNASLQNQTILITRSQAQASDLAVKIEQLGGKVIAFPVIKLIPARDPKPLEQAIQLLPLYDWIIFTSTNGVQFFAEKMKELGSSFSNITSKIAVVGPKTAAVVKEWGKHPDLMAKDYKAEGLIDELQDVLQQGQHILLPRANIAREILPEQLRLMGMKVTEVDAYETVLSDDGADDVVNLLRQKQIDIITFTSSSTVKNFCEILKEEPLAQWLAGIKVVCIGPITANTAEKLGLEVSAVAEEYTIDGLMEALLTI